MISLIKETAKFIRENPKSPDSLCCAEALFGIINHTMSKEAAVSAISSILMKNVSINDNVSNGATAFVVKSVQLMRDILVAQHYYIAYDLAELLMALPNKEYISDRNFVFDYNCTYIRPFNRKYPFRLPELV
ncbi:MULTISPECIES: hypothetical protein [Ruminococcus]|uniref:Uncharacterized protein n=1 Tax=Ruminococcus flavefaciens TaxID=1265 RepID=A0A1M7HYW6_RUMFL|nr:MULTISPECIES: hypothetical protein [Ruminococcus]MCR4796112.1 hypothetical protein [Ruminococcus sp.]SHM33337.1 hypothetical protein SAMN04487860_103166 [Ruminococcus flavefaciens]